MKRKNFIKSAMLGTASIVTGAGGLQTRKVRLKNSTYDKMMEQVGFNHLPPENSQSLIKRNNKMKTVLHKANTRGHANHGWLNSYHTFSFANYYNPERMHFGVLRVLNDDVVQGGKGFGTHPHDNMEIVSIPLKGDLEHKDSMGNVAVIKQGDVQIMSAGTGVYHSEFNKNEEEEVQFLQIWMFPDKKDVNPRYDQISLDNDKMQNEFLQIVSPNKNEAGVWTHQNAWFYLGELEKGVKKTYQIKSDKNGVYAFILAGTVQIEDQKLEKRDGFGVWETSQITISASQRAKILLMDVPMQIT